MRIRSLILALVLLLPMLTSCRTDSGNPPDGSSAETTASLRPVETIVINDACYGEFITITEQDHTLMHLGSAFNGKFYISSRMAESAYEGDAADRPFGYCVLSPEDGSLVFLPFPYACVTEGKADSLRVDNAAVSEHGMAVLDQSLYLDLEARRNVYCQQLLTSYTPDGQVRFSIDPEPLVTRHVNPYLGTDANYEFGVEALHYGANGTLYMVTEFSVVAVSPAGEKLYETDEGIYINNSWRTADGRVLVDCSIPAEGKQQYVFMDDSAKGFSAPVTVPDPGFEEYTLHFAEGWDFYYQAPDGLYAMNTGDTQSTLICSWDKSGILASEIAHLLVLSEDVYYIKLRATRTNTRGKYAVLRRPADEELTPRIVITLGDVNNQVDYTGYAGDFNRANTKYYIRIRDYHKQAQDGGNTLEQDILSGNAPDIVCTPSFTNQITNLASKGAFTDLNTFLDADPSFRDNLLGSVRDRCATDGKLYQLASGVTLSGFVGRTKDLPAAEEWTPETYFALLQNCADRGIRMLYSLSREEAEGTLLYGNLSSFVDYDNAVCSFESEQFLSILRYLKTLPTQELREPTDVAQKFRELREGTVLMTFQSLSHFYHYLEMTVRFETDDITFLGSPRPNGGRVNMTLQDTYAIAADSPVQEQAWAFVRYMLENGTDRMNFPVYKPLLEKRAKQEMQQNHVFSLVNTSSIHGYPEREIDPQSQVAVYLTEDHVAAVMNLLESRNGPSSVTAGKDETMKNLIAEEMAAYYAGSVTAEEAAGRIQSRVSIYLAEQS